MVLLIAISIIGLLVALILPAVRSSIERSQSVAALNKLRIIGGAVLSYAFDHNNTMVPVYFHKAGDSGSNADRAWIHELVINGFVDDRISFQQSPGNWVNTA